MSEKIKLHIFNNLPGKIEFTCGMGEYKLEPRQKVAIEVEDGDCIHIDQVEGCKCESEACTCQA